MSAARHSWTRCLTASLAVACLHVEAVTVEKGVEVTLQADAAPAGKSFHHWSGDAAPAGEARFQTSWTYVPEKSGDVEAVYGTLVTLTAGGDVHEAVVAAGEYGTVRLGAGTFTLTNQLNVGTARIEGAGRGDDGTKLTPAAKKYRALYLNDKYAYVSGLEVSGFDTSGVSVNGVGVCIDSNGGTVVDCRMTGNSSSMYHVSGGGAYCASSQGLIARCVIDNNEMTYDGGSGNGGGVFLSKGALENCLIRGNRTSNSGGGVYLFGSEAFMRNCTVLDNVGKGVNNGSVGVGVYLADGHVYNSAIYGNIGWFGIALSGSAEWSASSTKTNDYVCCASSSAIGATGLCASPDFVARETLAVAPSVASPLVNSGTNETVFLSLPKDLAGNPRTSGGTIDIGCTEYQEEAAALSFRVETSTAIAGKTIKYVPALRGGLTASSFSWTVRDASAGTVADSFASDGAVERTCPAVGTYTVELSAGGKAASRPSYLVSVAMTNYVLTLTSAAIQEAIDAAIDGSVILLDDGTYAITQTITVYKGLRLESLHGPEKCVLKANPKNKIRPLIVNHPDAVIRGITITGGKCASDGYAGSAIGNTGGLLDHCVISNNTSGGFHMSAGGLSMWSDRAVVRRSLISNNSLDITTTKGGGVYLRAGTIESCLIRNNTVPQNGGGVYIAGDVANVINCMFAGNTASSGSGGAVYREKGLGTGRIANCVFYNDSADQDKSEGSPEWYAADDAAKGAFVNCAMNVNTAAGKTVPNETCFVPESFGFADADHGDYSITATSPLVNRGVNGYNICDEDYFGNPRVSGVAVDVGYCEVDLDQYVCDFSVTPDAPLAGGAVVFTAATLGAGDGATYTWTVKSGDTVIPLASSSGAVVTNVFATYGSYELTLEVTFGGKTYTKSEADGLRVWPQTLYVSKADGVVPTAPYATPQTAAPDIDTALAVAAAGSEIVLSNDVYTITKAIDLTKDVTIRGATGRPEDVVLHSDGANHRILTMASTGALVHSLTVENAYYTGDYHEIGAGIYMYGKGGTVSNCIVRSCGKYGYSKGGGGIGIAQGSDGSLVTHCIVSNCTEQGSDHTSYPSSGSAIAMYDGTVRNCLLVKNYRDSSPTTASFMYGTVHVQDGTLENCTIADNTAGRCAGVWAEGSATVVNCLIANNKTLVDDTTTSPNLPVWAGSASCFDHCVSDGATPINENCSTATDPFVNAAGGDWHLDPSVTVAVDTGTKLAWMTDDATDFYGNPRVRGKGDNPMPDIGANEVDPYAMSVRLTLANTIGFKPAKAVATVTVTGGGDSGFTCEWDWNGDGVYEETTETLTAEHVYDAYGTKSITVRVTDKDSGKTAVSSSLAYSVYPKTMYVGLGADITPVSPYDSPATAAPDINTALAVAAEGGEIAVLPGVYTNSAVTTVEKAVTVRGLTGRAEDVVLSMKTLDVWGSARGLALGNAGAVVSGLTIENADLYSHSFQEMGAGVYIYNGGGTLSNCVVRNCRLKTYNKGGGGIGIASSATGALVTHCIISNCQELGTARSDYLAGGGGIVMFAGTVRNCLLTRNDRATATGVDACRYGTVRIVGGLIENCTIAGNSSGDCAGVWAQGGTVRNCVIVGNETTSANEGYCAWTGTAASFTNCVLDAAVNGTCFVEAASKTFLNPAKGNYRIRGVSAACESGVWSDWMTGAKDLRGRPRIIGSAPDCGAYENAGGLILIVR